MPQFRKLPVEIEARRFIGGAENATPIIAWVLAEGGTARWTEEYRESIAPFRPDDVNVKITPEHIAIDTLEGTMRASVGDWVIRGVAGEFYPCSPEIFAATYEPVDGD